MRLIVDASAAVNQGAGIGRYARMIVPRVANRLPNARITGIVATDPAAHDAVRADGLARLEGAGIKIKRLPFDRRLADILWFRARLPVPVQLFGGRADAIYSPDFTAPPALRTPSIITVHDLAFEVTPQYAPDSLRSYLQAVVPRQVSGASAIAVVSRTTARDLEERYRVDPQRITVVSNGVDERFFAAETLSAEALAELDLPPDYLLMVGTIEPRKNHVNAFLAVQRSRSGRELPLVVAGRRGWGDADIVKEMAALQAMGTVIWLDYVPDDLLPSLYAGAAATVYPSWYEGFGLPALEALAAGSPLVISTAPALVEVAGDVARTADAGDADALAEAIDEAVEHDRNAEDRKRRIARARTFDWDRPAGVLADLIVRIAG
jgi:glycosyltransferase involved in cell wall biosynthesis